MVDALGDRQQIVATGYIGLIILNRPNSLSYYKCTNKGVSVGWPEADFLVG